MNTSKPETNQLVKAAIASIKPHPTKIILSAYRQYNSHATFDKKQVITAIEKLLILPVRKNPHPLIHMIINFSTEESAELINTRDKRTAAGFLRSVFGLSPFEKKKLIIDKIRALKPISLSATTLQEDSLSIHFPISDAIHPDELIQKPTVIDNLAEGADYDLKAGNESIVNDNQTGQVVDNIMSSLEAQKYNDHDNQMIEIIEGLIDDPSQFSEEQINHTIKNTEDNASSIQIVPNDLALEDPKNIADASPFSLTGYASTSLLFPSILTPYHSGGADTPESISPRIVASKPAAYLMQDKPKCSFPILISLWNYGPVLQTVKGLIDVFIAVYNALARLAASVTPVSVQSMVAQHINPPKHIPYLNIFGHDFNKSSATPILTMRSNHI